jgi:DNA-binding transcriptional ArsR family regulator
MKRRFTNSCGVAHVARPELARPSKPALVAAAAIFRAAGEVSRLELLQRLSDGEWCVTELAEDVGMKLPTVSQQLRLLSAQNLVARRREGKHVYYVLADKHVADLIRAALEHAEERLASTHARGTSEA